jgi:hypothetical protein
MKNIDKIIIAVFLAMFMVTWATPSEAKWSRHHSGHTNRYSKGHHYRGFSGHHHSYRRHHHKHYGYRYKPRFYLHGHYSQGKHRSYYGLGFSFSDRF